ncbi:hypothetical protein, partial [Streptococcus oralis]
LPLPILGFVSLMLAAVYY